LYTASPKVSLGYNGTYQSRQGKPLIKNKWDDANSWWGSALYVNVDPMSWFGLTLRSEYLSDDKSVLGFDGNVFANTLSANFKIDNLTIIPELRIDNGNSSRGIFTKSSGISTKSTSGFLLAAVYHF
ncbi:MAG: porin, partial [Bacteroidota bacterium]|nr:porin [Bacteroidota bacterium]